MAKGEVKNSNVKEHAMNWPGAKEKIITMKRKRKDMNKAERSSGFIFICNTETMQEFFQYQVFGFPAGKREVVEKIKEGNRLFVFDFNTKLLHGVYKATSKGQMNLEPSAFGGRFPAQVRFSIHRHCIPVHESTFKSVIEDNCRGAEFEPELSAKQVRIPLLRWCHLATAPSVAPYPHLVRPTPPLDPYLSQLQFSHHVDVAPKIEPPQPPLVRPPLPVDPYPSQFGGPKVEPPLPPLARPPPPKDPYPSQFQYSHKVDIVPRVEPPIPHLRGPPLNPYPSQFPYSLHADVVPKVESPLPPLDPYVSQFQYSHRVGTVLKVEPPLPHLVRPDLDPYLSRLQYSHSVDVVPRIDPPWPVLQHEYYGNAGAVGPASQSKDRQDLPVHPSGQHYVIKNRNQFLPEDSTQLVQDRYPSSSSSSFPLPGEYEDKRSDCDDSSFEDLTPKYDNGASEEHETISSAAAAKHRFGGVQERKSELLEATVARYLNSYETSIVPNNTYPPTATNYHSYPSTTYPRAQTLIYPPQSVGSARAEPPRNNGPVSSLYSYQRPSR